MSMTRDEARVRGWLGNQAVGDVMLAPSQLLLDSVTGALAGYSVARKLRSAYSGSAIRVRRSSDNAEQDIGFDAGGDLDVGALVTFCGAGSGYVKTLYDQSASGLHLTQASATQQPRIVNAGVVDKLNGRPSAVYDGTNDALFTAAHGSTATAYSAIMVAMWTSGGASEDIVFGPGLFGSTGTGRLFYRGVNSTTLGFGGVNADRLTSSTALDIGVAAHVFGVTQAGNNLVLARDGVTEATTIAYGTLVALVASHSIGLGAVSGSGGYYTAMTCAEAICWPSQLTAADRAKAEDHAAWYYSTPATPNALSTRGIKRL